MRIYYPGVWDLFHVGHLNALRSCMINHNGIIVGVCSDELNYRLKGTECVYNEDQRRDIILSIRGVEDAFIYNHTDYVSHVPNLDVFVCGPEFGNREDQKIALDCFQELNVVIFRSNRTNGISTTELKQRIKSL